MPAPAVQVPAGEVGRVGRYELVTELAQSPFGGLWAARIAAGREEGRLVSLRRIARRDDDPTLVERLSEAAFAAMEVRHPKIVAVLDVVVTEREVAVASEYVDAQVLRSLLRRAADKRSPLPANVALRIGVDLLQALRAAHSAWGETASTLGLYGGVSPDNVMVATYGDVMLADLGVASVLSAARHSRQLADAVAYCAPEQLAENPVADERTDVFALGVLLWELLVNRPLFGSLRGAQDVATVSERVRTSAVSRIDAVERQGPPIPAAMVDLVARALERDPSARFPTLDAMLGALLAHGRGVVGTPEHVVMALDRLARNDIEARRASLASLTGGTLGERESVLPESGRPTRRPPPPEPAAKIEASGGTPAFTATPAKVSPLAATPADVRPPPAKPAPTGAPREVIPRPRAGASPPAVQPPPAAAPPPVAAPVKTKALEAPAAPPPTKQPAPVPPPKPIGTKPALPPKPPPKPSAPPPPPRRPSARPVGSAEVGTESAADATRADAGAANEPGQQPLPVPPAGGSSGHPGVPISAFTETPPLPPEPVMPKPASVSQPPDPASAASSSGAEAKAATWETVINADSEPAIRTSFSGPGSVAPALDSLGELEGRRRRARRIAIGAGAALGVLVVLVLLAVVFRRRSPDADVSAASSAEPVPPAAATREAPEPPQPASPAEPTAEAQPSSASAASAAPAPESAKAEPQPAAETRPSTSSKPAPPVEREPIEERRPLKKGYRPRGI